MKKNLQKPCGGLKKSSYVLILFAVLYLSENRCAAISYSSSDYQSSNSAIVSPNTLKNDMIRIAVVMTGGGTQAITQFSIDASSTTAMGEITAARIYCNSTLTNGTFAAATTNTLFGTGTVSGTTITVNGSVAMGSGTNYFWLTYDIAPTAVLCHAVSADYVNFIVVGGVTQYPSFTSSGYRTIDGNMTLAPSGTTTTQNNTGSVLQNATNNEIIGIHLTTPGSVSPLTATSFTFNTTGTTNVTDISNAKVWFTGSSSAFATTTQFGSTVASPSGSFTITGSQTLVGCNNYFWLTYDVTSGATPANLIDAECTSLIVSSTTYFPTVTAPSGNRPIIGPQGNYTFAAKAGGSNALYPDQGMAISVDASGNSYVTGYFYVSATFGSTTLTSAGVHDIFVAKYNSSGIVQWAKSAGGTNTDYGYGISTDNAGNCYVTGFFFSASSASFSGTTLAGAGGSDIFIAKYDPSGNVLWVKSGGGSSQDEGRAIKTDGAGNSYVTGDFGSATAVFGSTTITNTGGGDVFVAKYDPSGNVVWVKDEGGNQGDIGYGISIDNSGNSYITGSYQSQPTMTFYGSPNITIPFILSTDIFVAKLDPSGNALWAKGEGGANTDVGFGISTDGASGNSYVTGYFSGPSAVFSGNTFSCLANGSANAFIAKYDASGNLSWFKQPNSQWNSQAYAITIDGAQNSYVAGIGATNNAITFSGSPNITVLNPSGGGFDIWITKFDPSGNALCAQITGGTGSGQSQGIATDVSGNAYVTGFFRNSITFPGSPNIPLTSAGYFDIFLGQWNYCAAIPLPIEFISFKGKHKEEGNLLEWSTASEINNDYFTIERSIDENNYSEVGFVKGAGNSTIENNYSFTDKNPYNGINYYRLKQTNYNGNFTYSNTVPVKMITLNNEVINIYPNPNSGEISVSGLQLEAEIKIYNTLGQEVYNCKPKTENTKINLFDLPKGMYFLKAGNMQVKFIKQ